MALPPINRGWKLRLLVFAALAVASFSLPIAFVTADKSVPESTSVPASECPEANAVFEEAEIPPPDFYSECPDPDVLRADIESTTLSEADAQRAQAVVDALEAGVIREEQDPRTYPPSLREALGIE